MSEVEQEPPKLVDRIARLVEEKRLSEDELHAVFDRIRSPHDPTQHNRHDHNWGSQRVKIGLVGDTHIGSLYSDQKVLEDIYRRFKKERVEAVYHTGDLTEGYNRRKGHSLECELHGFDAQVQGVIDRYPSINGVKTYFITGDHDGWHKENGGAGVGRWVSQMRPDMEFLGEFTATVDIASNTDIMLLHPDKGTAYALSYHPQKMAEALAGGTKPNILGIGHYHKMEYLFYRNIHIFQTGCVQQQTPWMKRKFLSAHQGAWVLDVRMKKDGTVDRLTQTALTYYE